MFALNVTKVTLYKIVEMVSLMQSLKTMNKKEGAISDLAVTVGCRRCGWTITYTKIPGIPAQRYCPYCKKIVSKEKKT